MTVEVFLSKNYKKCKFSKDCKEFNRKKFPDFSQGLFIIGVKYFQVNIFYFLMGGFNKFFIDLEELNS